MARLFAVLLLFSACGFAKCIPFTDAPKNVGDTTCVTGKVVKVVQIESGTFFLNFCDDYTKCPFSVVAYPSDLRDVGDVRELEGKEIEIHGKIRAYHGSARMILRDAGQLRGEFAKLKPMPSNFDVDKHGNFSAGTFKSSKSPRLSRKLPSMSGGDEIDQQEQ